MPSTYSPSLRLELMGAGDQAGNWGNTTNTNLGSLIEQAITGVASIAMADSNYTLVNGNGIVDEARNAVLVMTGTLTATRSVIVPTSNKFYAVRNATTGSQSILVRTSAGTGVTLANGFTQLMYCDGTNVVLASVPINSTNSNVSIAGTLAVSSNATVGGDLAVTGNITSGGSSISLPIGSIIEYGGTTAPASWLLCDGAAVSRTTYAALFAVIGTAYGAGDTTTTFNVPNRRDRFGVGVGPTYTRGSTGGAVTGTTSSNGAHSHGGATALHTLTQAQMPSHQHAGATDFIGDHIHSLPGETVTNGPDLGGSVGGGQLSFTGSQTSGAGSHQHGFSTDFRGSSQGHAHTISTDGVHNHTVSTVPPYVASNYIIKA